MFTHSNIQKPTRNLKTCEGNQYVPISLDDSHLASIDDRSLNSIKIGQPPITHCSFFHY